MRHPHRHRLAALLPLQILAEAPSHSLPFPLAPEALSSALGLELGQSPRPRAKLTPTRNNTLHCGARGPQDPRTIKKDTPTQTPPSPTNFSRLGERPLHSIHRHTQLSANFSVPRQKKYTTQKQRQWQFKQHPPPSLPLHTRRILCSTSPRSRPQAVLRPSLSRRSVVRTRTCAPDTNPRKSHPRRSLPTAHRAPLPQPPHTARHFRKSGLSFQKHTHTPQRCLICTTRMPMESMGNTL